LLVACLVSSPGAASAIGLQIVLDGEFDDWTSGAIVHTDPSGDDGSSGIDFGTLWVASDNKYLFLRFETGIEVQGDENQAITLYLDTDLNASTGMSVGGIGADLVWDLGDRSGRFYAPSSNWIDHPDIGLQLGPTVSNTEFELALLKHAVPAGGQPLFPLPSLRFFIQDEASGGDRLPDSGSIGYTFTNEPFPTSLLPLEKYQPTHVRFASYNIQSDGLFDGGAREDALDRIFNAIDAEVWVINEVWDHSASEVEAKVEQFLPSGPGESWHSVKLDAGNVIVSRYPITGSWEIIPGYRLTATLLDLRPDHDTDLLFVANHWRCCSADSDRQNEADALIAFLRDARTPGGPLTLEEGTPIVAAGDFNLVGLRQQLDTVITGDIQNNGVFGPDSPPDWDGGPFAYPPSRHSDIRLGYTWRNDFSSFYPGVLDWIFYTESALGLENHFMLDTRTMLPSTLSLYGLQAGDSEEGSDHIPRVADFRPLISTSTPSIVARSSIGRLLPNAPNPFNPATQLRFELDGPASARVSIFDAQGRLVRSFPERTYGAGLHELTWNGRDDEGARLGSGVYWVNLSATGDSGSIGTSRSIVLLE
jgi:hypothetical protein